ncbi:MAG: hypothetical protein ABSA39_20345 [Edaphobacter sp.]
MATAEPPSRGHPLLCPRRRAYRNQARSLRHQPGGCGPHLRRQSNPNIAGLGGKVLTQVISRYYYPPGATDFSVLATKFGYSIMREVAFTSIREFYPDIAAHYIRKHREKAARIAARNGASVP